MLLSGDGLQIAVGPLMVVRNPLPQRLHLIRGGFLLRKLPEFDLGLSTLGGFRNERAIG